MTARDAAFQAWRDEAADTDMATALRIAAPGLKYKGTHELVGPCPKCGGNDRFALSVKDRIFNCRHCDIGRGAKGPIDLVMRGLGIPFAGACEMLTRRAPPGGEEMTAEERARLDAAQAERAAKAARDAADRAEDEHRRREKARGWARDLWRRGRTDWRGSPVEAYLVARGLGRAVERHGARLAPRWVPDLPFLAADRAGPDVTPLHVGPAMLARVVDRHGVTIGCHRTWVAPGEAPKHRPTILDAKGEVLPSKRMLGSKKGGIVVVMPCAGAARMILGEGIENVLAAVDWLDEQGRFDPATTLVATASDMGNLYGPPGGRSRAEKAVPRLEEPSAFVPAAVDHVTLVEDSMCVPEQLGRFVARWRRRGRVIEAIRAPAPFPDLAAWWASREAIP